MTCKLLQEAALVKRNEYFAVSPKRDIAGEVFNMKSPIDPASSDASTIAGLALRLHQESQTKLRLELPLDQVLAEIVLPVGCKFANGGIEFESLEVRNAIVAASAYDRLCLSSSNVKPDAFFERAYELWCHEIGQSDQASGRLLALASESIDVLAVAAERIRSGSDVFDVLQLIEAALPYLSRLETSSIVDLIVAKHEPTKNDMAAGTINGAIEKWLEARPQVACELHAKVLENLFESNASLLCNAIVALSKSSYVIAVEMAKSDASSDMLMQAEIGTWTLGRLLLDQQAKSEEMAVVVETVRNLISSEQSGIRSQAIRAAVGAMHTMDVFDVLLQTLAEKGDQDVLCAAANSLFYKGKEIRERGLTLSWLRLLPALKPEFKGAIRNLDFAMSQLLTELAYAPTVMSTLTQWVANHGRKVAIDSATAELFDHTIRKLIPMEACWFSLVTDWLLSDRQQHASALAGILTELSANSTTRIKLEKSRLDELSTHELLFLARRILGYVHDRAQVTSLSLSMLESQAADKRIYPLLRSVLVDEIGYDYPMSTITALREAADKESSAGDQQFLRITAEAIQQTVDAQNSLPFINELRPSTQLRRLFSRARAKQMDNSFEEANKNSIWRQIATQIPIKAGMGTFSYRESSYGTSMKLSSMSHSIELPRREVFDPVGNSIRHFGFRLARRDEP
jgi:hypothetical protein